MNIQNNINQVKKEIENACISCNRSVDEVTLIAVTKTKPVEAVEQAMKLGIIDVGENKVQEITAKYLVFEDQLKWHMIGHLQTNKVKYIIDKVSMIHSVDSLKLACIIDKEARKHDLIVDILIQVMIVNEDTKYGINEEALEELLNQVKDLKNIKVKGLMTIAPYVSNPEDNRAVFTKLRKILIDMNLKNIDNINMDVLSMGMTNDYKVAIEEGATMVRVGTAIFGERNYTKG